MTSELTIEPLTPFIGAEITGVDLSEVTQEQVFRRIRELNATTTSTDLRAFPVPVERASHGTQPGPLVSDLHRSLQKRGGQ